MQRLLNILTIASAILAILIIGYLVFGLATNGFDDGKGMAIVVFQLYGVITSVAALVFGALSFLIGKRRPGTSLRIPKLGIQTGCAGLLVLVAMMFL